ncbi:MAG: cytochrome c-type biogenesis CcmF C-terminal domain-containing protein, partial [Pseudomonadota bacterium]
TLTVLVGTLYPLLLEAAGGGLVSVGPPFFNAVFVPLAVPLVAVMSIGPLLAWKRADLAGALARLRFAALITVVIALGVVWLWIGGPVMAVLGVAMGVWLVLGALTELTERIRLFRIPVSASWQRLVGLPRSAFGLTLSHAGLGIAILGMVGASEFRSETVQVMAPGDSVEIAGYALTFEGVASVEGANYIADRGRLIADANGQQRELLPERRWYPVAQMPTTEAAIVTNWVADLYVALGDPRGDGSWVIRAWHHPLVPWIWVGAVVMVLGGLVSLTDRRLRVGAPRKAKVAASLQPAE